MKSKEKLECIQVSSKCRDKRRKYATAVTSNWLPHDVCKSFIILSSSHDRRSSNMLTIGKAKFQMSGQSPGTDLRTKYISAAGDIYLHINLRWRDVTLFNPNCSNLCRQFLTEKLTRRIVNETSAERKRHSLIDSFGINHLLKQILETNDVIILLVSFLKVEREYVL